MVMGIRDVTLESIIPHLEDGFSLYGQNFTKSSRVYVNGERQKTTFLNNTRIDLPETELENEDVIVVCQYGSSDTLFRKADEYIYRDGGLIVQEGTATDKTKSWMEQLDEEE